MNKENPNHSAHIVKLENVRPHPKADRLQLATVLGCTLVVGLDTKEGDIGVYFQSGLQLDLEYAKANDLIRRKDDAGKAAGGMFEVHCRVKAVSLRGIKSDGFFIGMESLEIAGVDKKIVKDLKLGDFFGTLGGIHICHKWVPEKLAKAQGTQKNNPAKKNLYPAFKKHFDTTQLRFNIHALNPTDHVIISEKAHGTSQRVGNVEVYEGIAKFPWYKRLAMRVLGATHQTYNRDLIGTRNVVLDKIGQRESGGFYSDNFREKASLDFLGKLHHGETVYYEVVGYEGQRPIMGTCDNKVLGKEFVKSCGKTTTFTYGCEPGNFDIYVYRITMTNDQDISVDLNWSAMNDRCLELGVKVVPVLYEGPAEGAIKEAGVTAEGNFEELFMSACDIFAGGLSTIDKTHIKEGVCIRIDRGLRPWVAKHKSMEFKILEGIVKVDAPVEGSESEV